MKCSEQFVCKIWKYHFEKSGITATFILNTSSKQQGGKVWAGLNRLRRGRRGSAVSISNGPRPAQPSFRPFWRGRHFFQPHNVPIGSTVPSGCWGLFPRG